MYTKVDIKSVFEMGTKNPIYYKNECRICLENDGILVNVCMCKGSIKYVNLECNENWRKTFKKGHIKYKNCELCNTAYKVSIKTNLEKKYTIIICFIISVLCFVLLYQYYTL